LVQLYKDILTDTSWPATGIACQFIQRADGTDLWDSAKKRLIVYYAANSTDAIYQPIVVTDFGDLIDPNEKLNIEKFLLFQPIPIHLIRQPQSIIQLVVRNL
jgi:hypothetical protein